MRWASTRPTSELAASVPEDVQECPLPADEHIALGVSVSGHLLSPFEPHAHPFGVSRGYINGLVACCSQSAECRISGHITFDGNGYRHA